MTAEIKWFFYWYTIAGMAFMAFVLCYSDVKQLRSLQVSPWALGLAASIMVMLWPLWFLEAAVRRYNRRSKP